MLLTLAAFSQLAAWALIIYLFIHSISLGFVGFTIWVLTIMYVVAKEQHDKVKGEK